MKIIGIGILAMGILLASPLASSDWTPAKRLTWTAGGSVYPAVAVDSTNTIHVVWENNSSSNYELYYKRSTDGGTTWSPAKRLTWTAGQSICPAVAVDSTNTIHVVWEDSTPGSQKPYHKKSTDGGMTWSAARRLLWNTSWSEDFAMAIDSSDKIHLAWDDDSAGNFEVYYRRSTDGGDTWSKAQRLTCTSSDSGGPSIATDSDNVVHVVWLYFVPENYFSFELFYRRSEDGGTTWSAARRLTWTQGFSLYPSMATDPSHTVHVFWQDSRPDNYEVFYKRSLDGGRTWTLARNLTKNSGNSERPVVAIDSGGTIHVAWNDDTPHNAEISYLKSEDGGMAWSTAQRLTWTPSRSFSQKMAIDSSSVIHIVWEELGDIYYISGR